MLGPMKRVVLFLVVVLVIGLVWWSSRGGRQAPDQRLADHARALCKIAAHGADDPEDGVGRLFGYYGARGPAMARDLAELLVLIERIDDDRAHDQRAALASRRLHAPIAACADTFARFGEAVQDDPEASARLERGMQRFGRTLEILLGGGGGQMLRSPLGDLGPVEALIDRSFAPRR